MYTFHIVSIFVVNDDLFFLSMVKVGHCHHIISMVYRDHQIIIFGWFFKVVFKLYCLCHSENRGCRGRDRMQGRIQGGGAPRAPPKIGKNMIFWRKIVIFHTKYPNNFRASLRSAQLFKVRFP